MQQVIQLVVIFFAALATGGLMVNWMAHGRAMSRLSASAFVEFHQANDHALDPVIPIVIMGAVLGGIVLVISSRGTHALSGDLAIAGSVCYAAVMVNVPINTLIGHWPVQSSPDDWTLVRAMWTRSHILRTLISIPALVCYVFACLAS
jgi:uncharacterized membrane protein